MMNQLQQSRDQIALMYLADEMEMIRQYARTIKPDTEEQHLVTAEAVSLIEEIRAHPDFNAGLDAFMAEYSLDSIEGIRLMTLAEALARIPDEETREALIRSKLTGVDWGKHIGQSLSTLVNSSTRALLFTSSVLETTEIPFLSKIIQRFGEPTIRMAIETGMSLFSDHFVLGETLQQARKKIEKDRRPYRYSFDMLGEAALTMEDARKFLEAYSEAIKFAGQFGQSSISIKLSALHPRYEASQLSKVDEELYPVIHDLVALARDQNVQITIDAEESDRLELSLRLVERLIKQGPGKGFDQLGLVVQAYSKRGGSVINYLAELGKANRQRIPVRLVKGAYWDTEIKHAQLLGLSDYPVFTQKAHTDIAYLYCARLMLGQQQNLYPQFATHNVQTVANILHWTESTPEKVQFEFQRLHGMGTILYDCLLDRHKDIKCCIYAPIGQQRELLPYLIRRLLENSANSSFVNQLASNISATELSRHPIYQMDHEACLAKPANLFPGRINSSGINLNYSRHRKELLDAVSWFAGNTWVYSDPDMASVTVRSLVNGIEIGSFSIDSRERIALKIQAAKQATHAWSAQSPEERASQVRRCASALQDNLAELVTLMANEAGKTVADSLSEIREAIDFCRYYANEGRMLTPRVLPGPVGESNQLSYIPRGTIACISPWNFPVAIFTGQLMAALVTGNTVIAKPAEQTSLVAHRLVDLFRQAGLPAAVLQLVCGSGDKVGSWLTAEPGINGVVFTGSVVTSKIINTALAARAGPIIPLIAETGGQNVMVVDSSALPEQVTRDVIESAFNAAGQRCSALRVLYLQEACADRILELMSGAMQLLTVGNPLDLATDVGPVIDEAARHKLAMHIEFLDQHASLISRTPVEEKLLQNGFFIAPCCYEIESINMLNQENFGPVLHVIRYKREDLPRIFDEIHETGFALTLGIHSRNESMVEYISDNIRAGNVYVNRNMIGAVVESQPFGGTGISGTGPKAGGPEYLKRFVTERCVSDNIAAIGGAIDLMGGTLEAIRERQP